MTRPNTVSDFVSLIGEPTDEGCWPWANKLDKGYGRFNMNGKTRLAHSMAYVLFGGFIADGLTLDHTCHNGSGCEDGVECRHRRCVNPAHLEPVPQQVNTLRGETVPGRYARQECCKHGHRYDVTGFRLDSRGARLCVQCIADRNEKKRQGLPGGDPRHGTTNGYGLGCRCVECGAAARAYKQAQKGKLTPDDHRHGTTTGYCTYACRCRPCTDAVVTADRNRRQRKAS